MLGQKYVDVVSMGESLGRVCLAALIISFVVTILYKKSRSCKWEKWDFSRVSPKLIVVMCCNATPM